MKIALPAGNWTPRHYQRTAWNKWISDEAKRLVLTWHRRAGKDKLCLNGTAVKAHQRVGGYWHMLPEASQARKAIWDAVDENTGIRLIDQAFPKELRSDTRQQDMFIRFHNGSTWQVLGSDNYDSLIGSPPVGVVFSEFAYSIPMAWQKISPILVNNGGWAAFVSTPFGRNHFHGLYQFALEQMQLGDPTWFAQLLTVEDTGVMTPEQIVQEELQLTAQRGAQEAQAIIRQEYYCSFDAAIPGAYYGPIIEQMERADPPRITSVPYDPAFMVETWWDLGIRDDTAIWFVQHVGREFRIIDYYEAAGPGLDHYANVLRERNYTYAPVPLLLPHDASHGQLTQRGGASLAQVMASQYGYKSRIVPQTKSLEWSINQVKSFLPTCVFDAKRCKDGLEKLRMYRRKWNDATRSFALAPLHDFSSHAADAFRTGVEGVQALPQQYGQRVAQPIIYNPFERGGRRGNFAVHDDDPLHR